MFMIHFGHFPHFPLNGRAATILPLKLITLIPRHVKHPADFQSIGRHEHQPLPIDVM